MWIVGNNNNNHNDSIRHRKTYIESLGGGRLGLNKFMFCTFSRKKFIFKLIISTKKQTDFANIWVVIRMRPNTRGWFYIFLKAVELKVARKSPKGISKIWHITLLTEFF